MSTVFDYSIQTLAFLPPLPTYNDQQNIVYVGTLTGDRIAVRSTSYRGTPYVKGHEYTDYRRFILFSHGNGDDIGTVQDYVTWLTSTFDCHVITYDYVNYGCSSKGNTSEHNMQAAITAVFEYLTNDLKVPPDQVLLMGKSLGTAPTVYLAAQPYAQDIQGVILVSPLSSGVRAVVPAALASKRILSPLDAMFCPSITLIQQVQVPVFIIHGYEDKVINIVNARILAKHLTKESEFPPLFVHAGHNDIEDTHPITLKEYMAAFMKHCEQKQYRKTEGLNALIDYDYE